MAYHALLIESQYFPSISTFLLILACDEMWVEKSENYQKSSLRNRCLLRSANGPLALSIPLLKGKHQQQPIQDVKISYDENWFENHWKSIKSCYGRAPYFIYYSNQLKQLIYSKCTHLFQLNDLILRWMFEMMELDTSLIKYTVAYQKNPSGEVLDARNQLLAPPKSSKVLEVLRKVMLKYETAFQTGIDISLLSTLDLILHCGPESRVILTRAMRSINTDLFNP